MRPTALLLPAAASCCCVLLLLLLQDAISPFVITQPLLAQVHHKNREGHQLLR